MARQDLVGSERCTVIAEIAQAHDGSLGFAHAFIDAVAKTGADAIKFQTHIAAEESTAAEPWRVRFSPQDETRYDYWRRMEFSEDQWRGLRQHASAEGLKFISSPFSLAAVDLLVRVGVDAWKIASGEVGSNVLFGRIADTGLPVLLSTGMSTLAEVDAAVTHITRLGSPLTVMQCTSMYPTPAEKVGLNMLAEFRRRYACQVGLSDHSATIYAGLAAATIGIDALEIHATLSREMFGPDVEASITTDELRQLVEGVRFIETTRANPVNKDVMAESLDEMRLLFSKSIVAGRAISAGEVVTAEDLAFKKPGTGIPATRIDSVVGRRVTRNLEPDEQLSERDIA